MSYTPPELNKINLELDEYIPPDLNQINFELSDVVFPVRLGLTVRKRLGREDIPDPLGARGIYRMRVVNGKRYFEKLPLYAPTNPQTVAQQANRQKLADGVLALQNLTTEEKESYNERAKGRFMSGYNLYLKEYLKSN